MPETRRKLTVRSAFFCARFVKNGSSQKRTASGDLKTKVTE